MLVLCHQSKTVKLEIAESWHTLYLPGIAAIPTSFLPYDWTTWSHTVCWVTHDMKHTGSGVLQSATRVLRVITQLVLLSTGLCFSHHSFVATL